jgi:predicted DNA-binding transcriptional regulator AlpA
MSNETKSPASERLALAASEVANVLGISERHVWALHSSGQLGPRPHRWGRCARWSLDELRAWLAAGSPSRERWESMCAPRKP